MRFLTTLTLLKATSTSPALLLFALKHILLIGDARGATIMRDAYARYQHTPIKLAILMTNSRRTALAPFAVKPVHHIITHTYTHVHITYNSATVDGSVIAHVRL